MSTLDVQIRVAMGAVAEIQRQVEEQMWLQAYPAFQEYAREVLAEAVLENPGQPYTITVDNRLSSAEGISFATKKVMIHFTQNAVMVAVREFAAAFQEISGAKQVRWDKMKRRGRHVDIPSTVRVFWWRSDVNQLTEVTNVGQIDNFLPGDTITVTSASPWQMYMNTKYQGGPYKAHPSPNRTRNVDGSGGYFGLVAKRIRVKLAAGPSASRATGLWVGAYRSRAILEKIGMPPLTSDAGIKNWNKLKHWGAWGILIRYSSRVRFAGLNQS